MTPTPTNQKESMTNTAVFFLSGGVVGFTLGLIIGVAVIA
jgi:hypothetical protein